MQVLQRMHGELGKLGIEISERTVSGLLAQPSRPLSQRRTFLANHVSAIVSMDFFTVSTLTGRILFVLVLIAHDHRRIVHVNRTERPTSAWTAQQLVETFQENTARWLL
jgi:putative transposase